MQTKHDERLQKTRAALTIGALVVAAIIYAIRHFFGS